MREVGRLKRNKDFRFNLNRTDDYSIFYPFSYAKFLKCTVLLENRVEYCRTRCERIYKVFCIFLIEFSHFKPLATGHNDIIKMLKNRIRMTREEGYGNIVDWPQL